MDVHESPQLTLAQAAVSLVSLHGLDFGKMSNFGLVLVNVWVANFL